MCSAHNTWADPDGGHRYAKTCIRSHKIVHVMPKNQQLGQLTTLPQTPSQLGRPLPPQRLRHLASSSSTTQVQCAPPKTVFWICPWHKSTYFYMYVLRCSVSKSSKSSAETDIWKVSTKQQPQCRPHISKSILCKRYYRHIPVLIISSHLCS